MKKEILSDIENNWLITARKFITGIYKIQGKKIPDFKTKTHRSQTLLYNRTHRELREKLMYHRHTPLDPIFMYKLRQLKSLPRSIIVILESFEKY